MSITIFAKRLSDLVRRYKHILIWLSLFGIFYLIGMFIPEGYDWSVDFSKGNFPSFWTPWTPVISKYLNWPLIFAITVFSVTYRTYRYNRSPIPIALAVLSLPTLWVLFLSNLDGLVLAGLLLLPWGVPLALMKPQLAAFALLAKKNSIIASIVWLLISLIIWGFWPLRFSTILAPEWRVVWANDITLFPWGAIIALPLLWFSRGDEDLLMAAGSFITPNLYPLSFYSADASTWQDETDLDDSLVDHFLDASPGQLYWTDWMHGGNVLAICVWLGIYFNRKRTTGMDDHKPKDRPGGSIR